MTAIYHPKAWEPRYMDNLSLGEGSGIFAALGVAVAGAVKFLSWAFDWRDRREQGREARLSLWEDSLVAREKAYREEIEHRLSDVTHSLDTMKVDQAALRSALHEVTDELHRHAPASKAVARARSILFQIPLPKSEPATSMLAAEIDHNLGEKP